MATKTGMLLVTRTAQILDPAIGTGTDRQRYRIQNVSTDALILWRSLPLTVTIPDADQLAVAHWLRPGETTHVEQYGRDTRIWIWTPDRSARLTYSEEI